MKKRLIYKLLPVAVMAAIGLFLAARATPQADAAVGAINPSSFTVNAGSPVGFSFVAQSGAGNVVITASSAATTLLNASCSGCVVAGNGTSAVTLTPPAGTLNFNVSFTLDVSCTAAGLPISVTASQGNSTSAVGVTGTCVASCATIYGATCGCTYLSNVGCGCAAYASTTIACGCGTYATTTLACGCGVYAANCGCVGIGSTASVYLNGALTSGCGCPGTVVTNGVYTNPYASLYGAGVYGGGVYAGGVYGGSVYGNNCGICTTNGLLANCAVGTSQVAVTVPGTAVCGSRFNVLATVRNSVGGIALDGTQVSLTSSMGVITPTTAVTSGGIASASLLLPPTGAGTATISATTGGANGSASVVVSCNAAPAPIVVAPAPVPVVIQQPIISAPNAGDGGCLAKGGCN